MRNLLTLLPVLCSDSPGHLEEKVSQLETMLKRLQDDLQKVQPLQPADRNPTHSEPHPLPATTQSHPSAPNPAPRRTPDRNLKGRQ